jgi:hypothetical protein
LPWRTCDASGQQSLKPRPSQQKQQQHFNNQPWTLDRVAAFCFTRNAHHSLNSLASGMVNQAP